MNARITNQIQNLKPALQADDVFQQVSVSNSTAATLATLNVTLPEGVKVLHLTANAAIRYTEQTLSGSAAVAPTATVGHLLEAHGAGVFMSVERARNCKFIAEGGSGAALLNITKLVE
jgi:hypothetical protein